MPPQFPFPPVSLADVLKRLDEVPDLSARKRSDLRWAVNKTAEILGRSPADVPAQPSTLSACLAKHDGVARGLSRSSVANMRSGLREALRLTGACVQLGKSLVVLMGKYKELLDRLESKYATYPLSRCFRSFQEQGLELQDVSDGAFDRFEANLRDHSICRNPRQIAHAARWAWNRIAEAMPELGLKMVRIGDPQRQRATLKPDRMPAGIKSDLTEFDEGRSKPDFKAQKYRRAPQDVLRPSTRLSYRNLLWGASSIAIQEGLVQPESATLVDVLQPDVIEQVLIKMGERKGKRTCGHIYNTANAAAQAAAYFARTEVGRMKKVAIKKLNQIVQSVEFRQHGMTDKNRQRLRPFNDERVVALFLHAPAMLTREFIGKETLTKGEASTAKYSLAHAIAINYPFRRFNLATLRIDRIGKIVRDGRERLMVFVPARETKTGKEDIEVELPPFVTPLYEFYVQKARPLLTSDPNVPWLFPGKDGDALNPQAFGDQLSRRISQFIGTPINTHLYRHIAAKLWLDSHDGDYLTVQNLMRHTAVKTTLNHYAELDRPRAARKYDEFIEQRVAETIALVARKSARSRVREFE